MVAAPLDYDAELLDALDLDARTLRVPGHWEGMPGAAFGGFAVASLFVSAASHADHPRPLSVHARFHRPVPVERPVVRESQTDAFDHRGAVEELGVEGGGEEAEHPDHGEGRPETRVGSSQGGRPFDPAAAGSPRRVAVDRCRAHGATGRRFDRRLALLDQFSGPGSAAGGLIP